jgi:hypothetical protein
MSSFPTDPASTTARLSLTDRLQREWYVTKVDFLAQDVPSGERKARRRELRSDLAAAAADVGMSRAIQDLGPASVLAHELKLAEGRKLPHVWTGVITFGILLYAWAGMLAAVTYALMEAAEQLALGRTVTIHATWLGATATITHGQRVLSAQWTFSILLPLVLIAVSLAAARAWRYRPAWLQRRLARKTVSAPTARPES